MLLKKTAAARPIENAVRPVLEGLEGRRLFAATLTVVNPFTLPGSDQVIFNRVGDPTAESPTSVVHSQQALTLTDTGADPLVISSLSLSGPFALVNAPAFPLTIASGASTSVTIAFTQTSVPAHGVNETNYTDHTADGAEIGGSLTIASNDATTPSRVVNLAGYYQQVGNNNEEPSLQTLINRLGGYTTNLGLSNGAVDFTEGTGAGSTPTYYGDEVVSSYWQRANTSEAVSVQEYAAYHTDGNQATLGYYLSSAAGTTPTAHQLLKSTNAQAQLVLPTTTDASTTPLTAAFYPSAAFGFKVDTEYSTDALNVAAGNDGGGGHHFRFFPVYDHTGAVVPNTYFMCMDYGETQAENFDFQDNVYVVSNITPAATPGAVTGLTATNAAAPVLSWAASTYSPVGYNVYRATTAGGTYTKLTASPITTTTFTDSAAPATGTVYYEVTAVDTTTSVESAAATVTARAGPAVASFTLAASAGVAQTFDPLSSATDTTGTIEPGTVLISTAPSNGGTATVDATADATSGDITYTPSASFTGTETLQYTVADSNGVRSMPGTITFNVAAAGTTTTTPTGGTTSTTPTPTPTPTGTPTPTPTPTPSPTSTATPTLNTYVGQTLVNAPITLPVLSTATGDPAFSTTASPVGIASGPSHGTAVAQPDGTVIYTPSTSFVGGDSFTYTATSLTGHTSASVTVDVNVGVSVGSTATYKTLAFTDADGTAVTVALNRGLADVYFDGTGLYTAPTKGKTLTVSGGTTNGLHIRTIALSGTTAASTLSITGAKNGQVTFGGLTSVTPLGTLNAKTANLTVNSAGASSLPVKGNAAPAGYVNLPGVRSISLATATDGTIQLGVTPGITSTAVAFTGKVTGTSLSSGVPITRLSASNWIANSGTTPGPITAPSLATLTVPGEFDADLSLTAAPGRVADLGSARVGSVQNGSWDIAGNTKAVAITTAGPNFGGVTAVGSIASLTVAKSGLASDVTAASIGTLRVAGTETGNVNTSGNLNVLRVGALIGSTVTVGTSAGLTTATPANIGTATLGTFQVTGRPTTAQTSVFSDSSVLAHTIKSAATGVIDVTAETTEGLAAASISSVSVGVNNSTVHLNRAALASNTTLAAYLSSKNLTLGPVTSFRVDIV